MRLAIVLGVVFLAGCVGAADAGHHQAPSSSSGWWPSPTLAAGGGWTTTTASSLGITITVASTVRLRDAPSPIPAATLRSLPASGIVVVASGWLAQSPPPSLPLPLAKPRAMPYQLTQFRHDRGWEGQPAANVPQYVLFTSLDAHLLDVRVFFGTQRPSDDQVKRAQAELDTLSWG
jgi:hypothetical protein